MNRFRLGQYSPQQAALMSRQSLYTQGGYFSNQSRQPGIHASYTIDEVEALRSEIARLTYELEEAMRPPMYPYACGHCGMKWTLDRCYPCRVFLTDDSGEGKST